MTPGQQVQCDLEMTGILLRDAEVRTRVLDGSGLTVPVMCLELQTEGLSRGHVHLEQTFAVGHGEECTRQALCFKQGARVTFRAPTVGIVLLARNCSHVYLHPQEETATEPGA